jgi:hypothetical protein
MRIARQRDGGRSAGGVRNIEGGFGVFSLMCLDESGNNDGRSHANPNSPANEH